jgi:hypothetical protein
VLAFAGYALRRLDEGGEEFRGIALDFRVRHGRKSNLMRLFEERG